MLKSMFVDCKQKCVLCNCPVGIYLILPEKGIKMCSNMDCEWPFAEEHMEIYDFSNTHLQGVNLDGPCPQIDLAMIETLRTSNKPAETYNHVANTNETTSQGSPPNQSAEKTNDCVFLKPYPVDEDAQMKQRLNKLRARMPTTLHHRSVITQPWMLRKLKINKVLAKTKPEPLDEENKFSIEIDTENTSGPAIKIELLPSHIDKEEDLNEDQIPGNTVPP